MHYIEKRLDSRYEVGIYGKSGYERSVHDTADEAIREYRAGMKFLNGCREPLDEIAIPEIVDKTRWPIVVAQPPNGYIITHDRVRDAIHLGLSRQQLDAGCRYEFRVVMVKVEEEPGFVGEGI